MPKLVFGPALVTVARFFLSHESPTQITKKKKPKWWTVGDEGHFGLDNNRN